MTFANYFRQTKQVPLVRTLLSPALYLKHQTIDLPRLRLEQGRTEMVQNLVELLSEDPLVRVDEFGGTFVLDPRSDLFIRLVRDKCYEPDLAQLCARYLDPERDAIDVGANIGFFTVLMALRLPARKVLAVEPTNNALTRLHRNTHINHVAQRVVIHEGVVSDSDEEREVQYVEGMEEYSSIGSMSHPRIADKPLSKKTVSSQTLDALVSQHALEPGLIKVDVEGAEHLVLRGAQHTLSRHRPVIISELSDFLLRRNGSCAADVVRAVEAHDYIVVDPLDRLTKPGSKPFGDILCVPRERSDLLEAFRPHVA